MLDEMNSELSAIKTRLVGVDAHLGGIDHHLGGIEAETKDLNSLTRNVAVTLAVLVESVGSIDKRMAAVEQIRDDLGSIKKQLDDFSGDILSSRRDRALQGESFNYLKDRLIDHERRLSHLESPEKKA
jgi:archaellum component FlaC